ncbi:MAG: hypothetical protein ABIE74_01680 [Pseudomonadota bacterium]
MDSIIRKNNRGTASVEFVWTAIFLVFIMLFAFVLFQYMVQNTGALVRSAKFGFSKLAGAVTKEEINTNGSGLLSISSPEGCGNDCSGSFRFRYFEKKIGYDYGLSSFHGVIDQSMVVKLNP